MLVLVLVWVTVVQSELVVEWVMASELRYAMSKVKKKQNNVKGRVQTVRNYYAFPTAFLTVRL
jgi:hypothetical protein